MQKTLQEITEELGYASAVTIEKIGMEKLDGKIEISEMEKLDGRFIEIPVRGFQENMLYLMRLADNRALGIGYKEGSLKFYALGYGIKKI